MGGRLEPSQATTPAAFLADHGLHRRQGRPIPRTPATVAALIDTVAEAQASLPAVVDRRTRLTCGALRAAVDRAVSVYRHAGLKPLDRVAVSLPNTVDNVVAFLAAMRAGLIWVGINTHLAGPEQRFILEDAGVDLLLAEPTMVEDLPAGRWRPVVVERNQPGTWWSGADPAPVDLSTIDPWGPAAIAYTSGTTGRPKGVVHSQHNMLLPGAAITAAEPAPLVQGVCLPLTILNMQVLGTVQTLLSGGLIVAMDRIDVRGVLEHVRDFRVQRMYTTPPTVYDLLTRDDVVPADISSLIHLGVGGAKLPEGLRERYRARFGQDFVVGYGLTEAPTGVTGSVGVTGPPAPAGSSGRARPQLEVTIQDAGGSQLGAGEEGEICIGPAQAGPYAGCYTPMLGYWDRPAATAEALRGGVLHTGDVGRIDADGALWVLDRRSELIVRGGANVYPAEVERAAEASGLVTEIAVLGRPHPRLGEEVVAFVRLAPGTVLSELDTVCREQLARYKVPVTWYVVEEFPRNAMGKVVRSDLRSWLAGGDGAPIWTVRRVEAAELAAAP
jgi:long-chain acyl-CoA synthetase